ncbi:MAG TPA: phospho-N-acetylmuramoyl-pentapeptide-transferase [Spirochaetia bacterium]|nr:phospho-N-acetylmuramoyl-pentapeptide-transferase [Spirochaetia bacterium]
MLKALLFPLVNVFTFFNIFQYITFRAAYAAVTALVISFIIGPKLIEFLKRKKAGQEIRKDGPETHQSKSGTPTMGGLLIIFAVVVSVLLWQDLNLSFTWICLFALLGFGSIGFFDDYLKVFRRSSEGLRAGFKFGGQTIVSTIIVLFIFFGRHDYTTLLYLPFFKFPVLDLSYFYIPFGVFILVSFSNAVNLTDGLDGLATGLVIMVFIAFAVISYVTGRSDFASYLQIPYIEGSGELTILSFAMIGASVGFLWYNSHPAEIFMGDTGALALGGLMGVLALLLKKEVLLVIIGGMFVIETVSVAIQVLYFKATRKRVFRMAPLHHHFEQKGWPESKVVTRFWILGGMFTILSLSTLKIQ